jgi:leucyl/phenylalanyl-tRNA--protein transferase
MRKILGRHEFAITSDTAFDQVIGACRKARRREKGTWITDAIVEGYTALHEAGYAHSVEAWKDGRLAGGLYGVSLGGIFFGESMFSASPNASKAAFITLVRSLQEWKFRLIDCQVQTGHLASLGAEMIPRTEFLGLLAGALQEETRKGPWTLSRAGG